MTPQVSNEYLWNYAILKTVIVYVSDSFCLGAQPNGGLDRLM